MFYISLIDMRFVLEEMPKDSVISFFSRRSQLLHDLRVNIWRYTQNDICNSDISIRSGRGHYYNIKIYNKVYGVVLVSSVSLFFFFFVKTELSV